MKETIEKILGEILSDAHECEIKLHFEVQDTERKVG